MACPPGLPSRPTNLGLGRSSSVAFGRTKTYSLARPAHQVRDAARAPRGRRAVPTKSVFEAAATQDWRPRLSGRTLRPNDDAVPPMEHIEDDRSDVLDADDVDRDTQAAAAVARAASAAAKTTVGRESDFRGRMALFMLEATWMALVG